MCNERALICEVTKSHRHRWMNGGVCCQSGVSGPKSAPDSPWLALHNQPLGLLQGISSTVRRSQLLVYFDPCRSYAPFRCQKTIVIFDYVFAVLLQGQDHRFTNRSSESEIAFDGMKIKISARRINELFADLARPAEPV